VDSATVTWIEGRMPWALGSDGVVQRSDAEVHQSVGAALIRGAGVIS
jgi:hypothetical protein